jgi:hypothetical protein
MTSLRLSLLTQRAADSASRQEIACWVAMIVVGFCHAYPMTEEDDDRLSGIIQTPIKPTRRGPIRVVGSYAYGLVKKELRYQWDQSRRESLSDPRLVMKTSTWGSPHLEMEMQRRLKHAVDALASELVKFRQAASEDSRRQIEMSGQLRSAVEALTNEVITSRKSSDTLAGRLLRANYLLVALTVVLVALTVVLAILAAKG